MVCMRNIAGLLLALAVAPSVMASPVNGGDLAVRAKGDDPIDSLIPPLGGDSSTTDPDTSGPTSQSPSASPTTSPRTTRSPTSATPTTVPSTSDTPSQGPTTTSAPPIETTPSPSSSSPTPTSFSNQITLSNPSGSPSIAYVIQTIISTGSIPVTAQYTSVVSAPTSTAAPDSGNAATTDNKSLTPGQIGGIVGGIAGAILLAGLAAVAWRVWGKNRSRGEEDDGLMDDGVYGTSEVKASGGASSVGASPFQNNLEQYHTPGRANPSANF